MLRLPTVVLDADPRVAGHAQEYGRAVGARAVTTEGPDSIVDTIAAERLATSVTLVLPTTSSTSR